MGIEDSLIELRASSAEADVLQGRELRALNWMVPYCEERLLAECGALTPEEQQKYSPFLLAERPYDYEVLRAIVMTLLAAYYRARPGDTRFEKKALAALPAEYRAVGSVQLGQMTEAARKLAPQVDV